ncbi:L-ascorbate oxidase homolog [Vigna radiata var. radiata]|uniref:L-ascorbate oxidase homolog n=1 Tax=Vigna radiata var. radiata TaxID=3916 RepID=A0A1S3UP79_VIGRR|nr:L-ascorbate oxidase homolog [Vigna radiata var. radiata]XP_014507746.1 L-ascorbate oxidase homolog [Vigna radiata var. radiata]XP_014507853.1 L-ascorbate oxidase homolog [Vigna radiata var. radiata]
MGRISSLVIGLMACLMAASVRGEDPYIFYTWNVTYGTVAPLGVEQQGILINGLFPGPEINCSSNNNIVVNVFNFLDEPLLFTWHGIQQRKNSWQDGTLGAQCPILPGTNYTYHFQVKDQIGSYFYYPSIGMHRAVGGFGGLRIYSRLLIPVPYADPADEFWVLIGDWYGKTHQTLRQFLDSGRSIGRPSGVHINGKNGGLEPAYTMEPGKTYKYRICNVGIKDALNFRIQGHPLKLVEMEGSHVVQNIYDSLDVHVGQCFSVLVTADKEPKDYYMVASTRFTKKTLVATRIIRYSNGVIPASPELPLAPEGWAWSLNQFRSFRWNLTASAARPNPQGSYHYGQINITRTIKLVNTLSRSGGKLRYGLNGVSHLDSETPLKLAEYYGVSDKVFQYNLISDDPVSLIGDLTLAPNVINANFRDFIEIIFENPTKVPQTYNLDGYSFFAVAIEPGKWSPEKRKNYNLLDAVSRHTIQVFPKSWAAIMLTFDNAGMWNLRSELGENRYLGQQLYVSVLSPNRSLRDEYNLPDTQLLCGIVKDMPKPPPYSS